MQQVNIFNIHLHDVTQVELAKLIVDGGVVFTVNIDHLVKLQRDSEFYEAYQEANYCTCDSQLLFLFLKLIGKPIKKKISGSDFFPFFYNYYKNDEGVKIFLLGSLPGVAFKAQRKINQKVGREIIVGTYSPYFGFEYDEAECQEIIRQINKSGATVLVIGLGAPKQEKWIQKYRNELKTVKTFLALGATIDFEAGKINRAPRWICTLGLEWLYRLLQEPKRLWKRYLIDDSLFLWLMFQQCLNLYRNPWENQFKWRRKSSRVKHAERPLASRSRS
jgi:N-acetylglucosaminyldiphosphoundecaprenol N-acetyl-beta-D-mannosaminyltransferase